MSTNLVFFVSHFVDEFVLYGYNKLRRELPEDHDLLFILDNSSSGIEKSSIYIQQLDDNSIPYYEITDPVYHSCIAKTYCTVNPIVYCLKYINENRDSSKNYDYYYIVEYDVWFGGRWSNIFDRLSSDRADLIAGYYQKKSEHPEWVHWDYNYNLDITDDEKIIRTCLSFCRLSCSAMYYLLSFIDTNKLNSLYELWVPTLLYDAGYECVALDKLSKEFSTKYNYLDSADGKRKCYSIYTFYYDTLEEILDEHPDFKGHLITRVKSRNDNWKWIK